MAASPMGFLFTESSFDPLSTGPNLSEASSYVPSPLSVCLPLLQVKPTLCHYKCIPGSVSSVGLSSPLKGILRPGEKLGRPQNIEEQEIEGIKGT